LLDAAVTALRREDVVKLDRLPRMADFATWVSAAEPGLGWREGRFLDAYWRNIDDASSLAVEGSVVAGELQRMALPFEGTADELLVRLNQQATQEVKRGRSWPRDATRLSGALRRVAPNLRKLGILIEFLPREGSRRPIRISLASSSASSASSKTSGTSGQNGVNDADDADDARMHTSGGSGDDWGEA
jgi:hypothetical protein